MALGNLTNELGPHSLHKLLALTNWHHERTQAANHAVEVEVLDVAIPTSFEQDRNTVDDDPSVESLVPGVCDGSALVVSSIPADVYDATSSLHAAPLQEQNAIINGRRD